MKVSPTFRTLVYKTNNSRGAARKEGIHELLLASTIRYIKTVE
jgi:hypothetical protein